jgi:hypothetical protein
VALRDATANAVPTSFDRETLYTILDGYLARDPARVPWAPRVRYSENNLSLLVGDGAWNTVTGLGDYDLRFADLSTGQVGLFGLIEESSAPSPFVLRLRVETHRPGLPRSARGQHQPSRDHDCRKGTDMARHWHPGNPRCRAATQF